MDRTISNAQINELAIKAGWEYSSLKAIIAVESGQIGFSSATDKIIIQFEPAWFKRLDKDWRSETANTTWQSNGVGDQKQEWLAFNSAYDCDPDAAMKSTSIGMMQLMGFHYGECGFKKVGDMWDYAKQSEYNQLDITIRWIKTVPVLDRAIKVFDPPKISLYYNGVDFAKFHYPDRLIAARHLAQPFKIAA